MKQKEGQAKKKKNSGGRKKVLLAFSGGLDTSAIVPWLTDEKNLEVFAYCADLGHGPDPKQLEAKAKRLGATELIFEDLKETFTRDFVFPLVRAGAIYQDDYLLGTSVARPLIAERSAYWAHKMGMDFLSHGATGKGNDQLRFERSWSYLNPEITILAPWKEWSFTGREDLVKYLKKKKLADMITAEKKFSVDVNLFHRSCEGGILETLETPFQTKEVYEWVASPSQKAAAVEITLEFKQGFPVSLNGKALSPAKLLHQLNTYGSEQGIGVVDLVEERVNGIKSRGVYETPGGTILHRALRTLKHMVWDRSTQRLAANMALEYANLCYEGLWHSLGREMLEASFLKCSQFLQGKIKLRLENGKILVLERFSPFSLYKKEVVSFEEDPFNLLGAAKGYCQTLNFSQWQSGLQRKKLK